MSSDDPRTPKVQPGLAIAARGLSKAYRVYARPQDRLWQMLWRGRRSFYREFPAVSDVDLEIRHGETVGIVGRNGSGKSTLLRLICGTLEPSAGELALEGDVAPLLALGTGFNREFTGRENVFMNAAILGMTENEIHERLDSIIAFADIGDFFDQPVKSYSAGMYSRLAFAVAVNSDPDILIIDEVLAVGDEAFNRKCFARIGEIKQRGATILFVSHSADRIIELCDWALLMDGGERLLSADPKTVISYYKRLIHAPRGQAEAIRHELRALDAGGGGVDSKPAEATTPATRPEAPTTSSGASAFYDPGLLPESTVDFPPRGARIANARILDGDDQVVNLLKPGQAYTYAYEVQFTEPAASVRFGMMLKPVSGFELGGQVSHPEGSGIDRIEAGTSAGVRFHFRAALAPGAYFLNAGVLGQRDDGEGYLHRVLDAFMFRVLPEGRGCVTGRVDLSVPGDGEPEVVLRPPTS